MQNIAREVVMKRLIKLLVLTGVALAILGCTDMFTFNLFSGMDRPRVPSVEDIDTMGDKDLLDRVSDLVESDDFYDDIAAEAAASADGTSETKDAIIRNLNEIIDNATEPTRESQKAALLVAEVELNSTIAGEVVDNFVVVATSFIETPPDTSNPEQLAQDLIEQVFGDVNDPDEVILALDALLKAADAYKYYGESLDTSSGQAVAPPDDNIGAIAQDAVISLLVAEMLDASTGLTQSDLEAFIADGTPLPAFTISGDPFTDNTALVNILEASGIGDLLNLGGAV
jgi:hypothetical protein